MKKNECPKCEISLKNPLFWETHQTMSDNSIWCLGATKYHLHKYLGVYSADDLDRID